MRAYRLDCKEVSLDTGEIRDFVSEIHTSVAIIVDGLFRRYDAVRKLHPSCSMTVIGYVRGKINARAIADILEVASINENICTISFSDKEANLCYSCSVRPVFIEDLSDMKDFVGAHQSGRQEAYDFIKKHLAEDDNIEHALTALASEYKLEA